jgi:hypothetical protein
MPRGGSRAGAGRKVGSVERKTAIRIVAPLIQGMAAKEAVTAARQYSHRLTRRHCGWKSLQTPGTG